MKTLLALLMLAFTIESVAQTELPLFAKLIEIKNLSEFELSSDLTRKELAIAVLDQNARAKARQESYEKSLPCLNAYVKLKTATDKLILQLKADMTLCNKTKFLRDLQKGKKEMSWYNDQIKLINEHFTSLLECTNGPVAKAKPTIGEITGIFSALVGLYTNARDARTEKVKTLCAQLDALRMKDVSALVAPTSVTP